MGADFSAIGHLLLCIFRMCFLIFLVLRLRLYYFIVALPVPCLFDFVDLYDFLKSFFVPS